MDSLPVQLALALGMTIVMIVVHLTGLMSLLKVVRFHLEKLKSPWVQFDRVAVPMNMVFGLFLIHWAEIAIYALLYKALGLVSYEEALYVSAGAYSTATLQYFDQSADWRLLASLEAVSGMLLIGWSTAFLFSTLHRILTTEETHPLPEGAIAPE